MKLLLFKLARNTLLAHQHLTVIFGYLPISWPVAVFAAGIVLSETVWGED